MSNQPPALERKSINEAIAEAQARPLEYDPQVRARYVRDMVSTIGGHIESGKTKEEIAALELDFSKKYKNLFDTLTQTGGYNKQNLTTMLALLDRMGQGELNQHQASVIVGQKLAEKYVNPSLK
jgi:hypothetical protein